MCDRNIRQELTVNDIRAVFTAFGDIKTVEFIGDPLVLAGGTVTRTATVVYSSAAAAKEAATSMNCFNLGGLPLVVLYNPLAPVSSAPSIPEKEKFAVVLEDMISIEEVNDPDLKDEISEEVEKFGKLTKIDIKVADGKPKIELVFQTSNDASNAFKAMNGRNFGGNIIRASLI